MEEVVRGALAHSAAMADRPILVIEDDAVEARIMWVNRAACQLLRQDAASLIGTPLAGALDVRIPGVDDRPAALRRLITAAGTASAKAVALPGDGCSVAVTVNSIPVPRTDDGARLSHRVLLLTETDETRRDLAVETAEARLRALAEGSPAATLLSDVGMRLSYVNDAFADLVGRTNDELLGTGWLAQVHPEDLAEVFSCAEKTLCGQQSQARVRLVTSAGSQRIVRMRLSPSRTPGYGAGFVGTLEDLTDALEREAALLYQARYDELTGLPNRTTLWEHLSAVLVERSSRQDRNGVAIIFVDLDHFKIVNDGLGHDAGDRLLVTVAERLRSATRDGDLVCRLGGDEFVVCCEVNGEQGARVLADRLLSALGQPVAVQGVTIHPAASLGVALLDPSHVSAHDWLRDADAAMYAAKALGRGGIAVIDEGTRSRARDALSMVVDLRHAIDANALAVSYLPVIDLSAERRMVAVEALLRWEHPTRGAVPAATVVRLAEQHGLARALDRCVLNRACADLVEWTAIDPALAPQRVHVNVTGIGVATGLEKDITQALGAHDLPSHRLCLELPESALGRHLDVSRPALDRLRAHGVALAIDDFGTGVSSLSTLQQLQTDYLKVDRAFITELSGSVPAPRTSRKSVNRRPGAGRGAAVVAAVIALSRSLQIEPIAEGVDHPAHIRALTELGCHLAQGFLLAPPRDAAQVGADLIRQRAGS